MFLCFKTGLHVCMYEGTTYFFSYYTLLVLVYMYVEEYLVVYTCILPVPGSI
jgi:hypothetical protein